MAGFQIGFNQGARNAEEQAQQRRELANEKRKTTLKTLLEDAETPQDKVAAIEAVYHQDPSVLKQHVENLTRRLTGKQPQPVVSPADAQAQRLAPLAAKGTTREKQQINLPVEQKQALLNWYQGLNPEQRKTADQIFNTGSAQDEYTGLSPEEVEKARRIKVGLAPRATDKAEVAAKPLEAGGIPYGVQTPSGTFFANQMNDPNTPPEVKQTWQTIQAGLKAKQDEQDKKAREQDERQLRGFAAIAGRQANTEMFQEQMANYRADLTTYRTLDKQARDSGALVDMYQQQLAQPGNKSAFDTALITDYTGILAKGGRKTQAEINFAQKIGGLGVRTEKLFTQAQNGELPDSMRKLYIDYMKARAASDRAEADAAKPEPPGVGGGKGAAPKSQPKKHLVYNPATGTAE